MNTESQESRKQGSLFDAPNPVNEGQVRRTAEAFMDIASDIPEDAPIVEPVQQPRQPSVAQPVQDVAGPALNHVGKSLATSGLNLGPKYLDALSQLDAIQDTKAVSVQLPMAMKKVELTAITGAEEQALKTASVAPEAFLKKLNELLYNHTIFEDGSRPSFGEYLSGIYPPDKSTLIWGLLSASYVVLPDIERTCTECDQINLIKSVPKDLIHDDTFQKVWDNPISPADFTIKQEAFDGFVTLEFGIPNEKDRILVTGMIHPETMKGNIAKEGTIMSQLDALVYFTRSITVGEPGQQTVLTNLTQDIYPFIQNLSPKIADGIRAAVDLSIFDEYMPEFYLQTTCDHCGADQRAIVDPEMTFFRKSLAL